MTHGAGWKGTAGGGRVELRFIAESRKSSALTERSNDLLGSCWFIDTPGDLTCQIFCDYDADYYATNIVDCEIAVVAFLHVYPIIQEEARLRFFSCERLERYLGHEQSLEPS